MNSKYIGNLRKRFGLALYKHKLINEDDKILIALSGGKDSFALLDLLSDRLKYLPFSIELAAIHIHIDNIGYQSDVTMLEQICKERNVPFFLKNFEVTQEQERKKSVCFWCSWNRRKAIFTFSKELGFNKLAFGHHMNDAVETLLMNQIYHGSISSLPYRFSMFDGRIELIRPLLDFLNDELLTYSKYLGYKPQLKECPHENTCRNAMREQVVELAKLNKVATKNIFRSMNKICNDYLPQV